MTESEYAYENYSAAEIVAAENYREQVREYNGHTEAARARFRANTAQIAEWNAPSDSGAIHTLTCDGIVFCVDCPMRNTDDCEKYQARLTEVGRGDDAGPNFWNVEAEKVARIERILGDTRHRRGNPNPVYFLDAGDLCRMGK